MYAAKVLADSVSPTGIRLTTMELTYPRMVHSEFMTHRQFSRNAASSRAIPISKMIEAVQTDPAMPVWWGKNQSGMQAKEELNAIDKESCRQDWLRARDSAIEHVNRLAGFGLHKQIANRLLEPWMWITVVCTATEWTNFFSLRCHPDAQPEIQKIAFMARDLYQTNRPASTDYGDWHLPYVTEEEIQGVNSIKDGIHILKKVSVARCARVSYLRNSSVSDIEKDIELHDRLASSGHWSPMEHIATPLKKEVHRNEQSSGNLKGWKQYRKEFLNECQ